MQSKGAHVIYLVENHLISEGRYGNCKDPIGIEKACFKKIIIFWIDLQKNDEQQVGSIAKISHVIVPSLGLIINIFSDNQNA